MFEESHDLGLVMLRSRADGGSYDPSGTPVTLQEYCIKSNLKCLPAQALTLRPLLEALQIHRLRLRRASLPSVFSLSVFLMTDAHFIYDHDYEVLQIF